MGNKLVGKSELSQTLCHFSICILKSSTKNSHFLSFSTYPDTIKIEIFQAILGSFDCKFLSIFSWILLILVISTTGRSPLRTSKRKMMFAFLTRSGEKIWMGKRLWTRFMIGCPFLSCLSSASFRIIFQSLNKHQDNQMGPF